MINLEAKTKPQELILAYLEKNATEELIAKINSGVQIEKDGVKLISKKTLDGFMTYASGEARKLATSGANSACVEDSVVYGWAMHFFQEDSIEGTLYNLDGTEYKPPKKEVKRTTGKTKTQTATAVKTEPQQAQYSLFDMMNIEEQEPKKTVTEKPTIDEILEYNIDDNHDDDKDEEEIEETADVEEPVEAEHVVEQPKPKTSSIYEQYLELEKQNPTAVVLMRLGDFYEVFGGNAIQLAGELNMTLTGRDFGYPERIPMIGFRSEEAYNYLLKIGANHDVLVCENGETTLLPKREKKSDDGKHWIDKNTYVDDDGVIHEVNPEAAKEVKREIPDWLVKTFNGKIVAR